MKWITQSEFNLDTTQTTVSIKEGKGVIPIKWREKQSDGTYAPKGMYYKGWVVITAGESTKSIPLFWTNGQPLDTTKIARQLMTRSTMAEPRLAAITFTPNPVVLSASKGGKVIVRATEVSMAILDYSDFKDSYNLDLNDQVDMLEGDTPAII